MSRSKVVHKPSNIEQRVFKGFLGGEHFPDRAVGWNIEERVLRKVLNVAATFAGNESLAGTGRIASKGHSQMCLVVKRPIVVKKRYKHVL
jgi:hypothetical protein